MILLAVMGSLLRVSRYVFNLPRRSFITKIFSFIWKHTHRLSGELKQEWIVTAGGTATPDFSCTTELYNNIVWYWHKNRYAARW